MKIYKNTSFTLIEVLLGIVVISVISFSSWFTVTTLMRLGITSRNRSIAVNLIQKSQEELRHKVQTFFDDLEDCEFPPEAGAQECGFVDITDGELYPEYAGLNMSRQLNVLQEGSPELKKVYITVSWTEFGQDKTMESVLFLTRPPEPLPGNIFGLARPLGQENQLVDGAYIIVTLVGSTETYTTLSMGTINEEKGVEGANYDFAEPDSGRFMLPAGSWLLRATHEDYMPYVHPTPITLSSGLEVAVNINMEPKPDNARISGTVVNLLQGFSPIGSFSRARINLYDDGSLQSYIYHQKEYSFSIPFEDTVEQCFTINTYDAFKAGYAYPVNEGGSPSCVYMYNREGWSSSVMQEDASLICSNVWQGNQPTDRICVSPGENKIVDIPVAPVPEVVITGRVIDSKGQILPQATIRARWPRSDYSDWRKEGVLQTTVTDSAGRFSFSVPAVQGLYLNGNPNQYYLEVWAYASVPILGCCELIRNETRSSPRMYVGPLYPGDAPREIGDLVISVADTNCGDAQGLVTDDFAGNAVMNALVRIYGSQETTEETGEYLFACEPEQEGYYLPVGHSRFRIYRDAYYNYDSRGNTWYAPRPDIYITSDVVTEYDALLWPQGYGDVQVNVTDQSTSLPVSGAQVVITPYYGSNFQQVTSSDGIGAFYNIPETWPPPSLPTYDPAYYRHNNYSHLLEVTHPSGIYLPYSQVIPQLNDGEDLIIDVNLQTQGNM